MIRSAERLKSFERRYARERLERTSYMHALGVFAALWRHARELDPGFPGDWRSDLRPDVDLARALNGIPRRA